MFCGARCHAAIRAQVVVASVAASPSLLLVVEAAANAVILPRAASAATGRWVLRSFSGTDDGIVISSNQGSLGSRMLAITEGSVVTSNHARQGIVRKI